MTTSNLEMYGKVVITLIGFSFAPVVLGYCMYLKYKKDKKVLRRKFKKDWDIIFTTVNSRDCKQHLYKKMPCSKTCSYYYLFKIVEFIETSKFSVSLCMCLSTFTEIQDALIRAHDRGVNVRFVCDSQMIGNDAAKGARLKSAQIPIKVQPNSETILHHKFCLVDEKYPSRRLFFGSLNLTCQGLTSNWDLIIFTSNAKIIKRFSEEYEYLWLDCVDY